MWNGPAMLTTILAGARPDLAGPVDGPAGLGLLAGRC